MFRRLVRWWKDLFAEEVVEVPVVPPLPEDIWERVRELCKRLEGKEFVSFKLAHMDIVKPMYTDSIDQAFSWLETAILSIRREEAILGAWEHRRKVTIDRPLPDYFYNDKFGYRAAKDTHREVSEKITIIHNLLEAKSMNATHPHFPYVRREFTAVMRDVDHVLTFLDTLVEP